MTEIFVKCRTHGRTHIKEFDFNGDSKGECGCIFWVNSGVPIRNITEEREREKNYKYVDDHKGRRYPDGSREFEGIMLQDGSYI